MTDPRKNKAAKLAQAAAAAAEVRAYQTDPDVIALRIERMRGWVDRLIWTGMVLGLLFTMTNVARFAADGARPPWSDDAQASGQWVTAWLLDPMVSLVLIGILLGEQIISRHNLKAGGWVRITKWVTLGATYAMNTWTAWASHDAAQILLHSVPVVVVFCAAEAVVTVRERITQAVTVAHGQAVERATARVELDEAAAPRQAAPALDVVDLPERLVSDVKWSRTLPASTGPETPELSRTDVPEPSRTDVPERTRTDVPEPSRTDVPERTRTDVPERTRTDVPEPSRTDVPEPSRTDEPKRTRTEPDGAAAPAVDRDTVVAELAEEILAAMQTGEKWTPDYGELMTRTGRKRSWSEKVVSDARRLAAGQALTPPAPPAKDGAESPRTNGSEPPRTNGSEPPRTNSSEPPRTNGSEPPRTDAAEATVMDGAEATGTDAPAPVGVGS